MVAAIFSTIISIIIDLITTANQTFCRPISYSLQCSFNLSIPLSSEVVRFYLNSLLVV